MKLYLSIFIFLLNCYNSFNQCRLALSNWDPTTSCYCIPGMATTDMEFCVGNKKFILVFEDEFNNPVINDFFWDSGGDEDRGDENCYFSYHNNLIFEDGVLRIQTRREPGYHRRVKYWGDNEIIPDDGLPNLRYYEYTTGKIRSIKEFQFGMFEIRAKIPKPGSGLWPAFWLFGYDALHNNHHELDIFESNDASVNGPFMTTHTWFDNRPKEMCMIDLVCQQDFSTSFHTISAKWDPGFIDWYVDGENVLHVARMYDISGREVCYLDAPALGIFNQVFPFCPMSIIANSAAHEDHDSYPSYDIDYIKIWQRFDIIDKTIWPSNISHELYNVEAGRIITIDGGVIISNKNQLKIIASDQIIINPGFSVELGCEFEAIINSAIE